MEEEEIAIRKMAVEISDMRRSKKFTREQIREKEEAHLKLVEETEILYTLEDI